MEIVRGFQVKVEARDGVAEIKSSDEQHAMAAYSHRVGQNESQSGVEKVCVCVCV
jgi:hypothetical protein